MTIVRRPESPCKNCKVRKVTATENCHSTCEKYIEYVRLNEAYREQMRKNKEIFYGKNWYQTTTGWWRH